MRSRDLLILIGPLIVAFFGAPTAGRAASFEWMPSVPNYGYASAADISGDGTTVVGDCTSGPDSGMTEACRWNAGTGWQGLGYLPGHDISAAAGVSTHGNVVVGDSFSTTTHENQAFLWTRTGGMTGLGFLPGTDWSFASAVSASGNVVAGTSGGELFRWTQAGGMQALGYLPGYLSIWISGISADGAVVVGWAYSNPISGAPHRMQAFRWTGPGGMQGLGFLPPPFDYWSRARAASADGSVVVGTSGRYDGDWVYDQAVVWRQSCECLEGLGFLTGGVSSSANDISADGTVIVGSSGARSHDGSYGFHAVVWTPGGGLQKLTDILESKGVVVPVSLYSADKVSADGRWIMGHTYLSGVRTSFRAYIGTDTTGTGGPDNLTGTPGDDVIDGKGEADVMTGLAGNDTYIVDVTGDIVVETANEGTDTVKSSATYTLPVNVEKLILTGTLAIKGSGNSRINTLTGNSANNVLNGKAGADIIRGRAGNDVLIGGPGADMLTGGSGRDRFLFSYVLGSANIDRITDFTPADDRIHLENAVFTGLPTTGTLAASAFAAGTAATNAAHRILYDATTGSVRYDADGTGPIAAVRFVTLTTKPALTRSDFYVQ